jgi:hypothetical protein
MKWIATWTWRHFAPPLPSRPGPTHLPPPPPECYSVPTNRETDICITHTGGEPQGAGWLAGPIGPFPPLQLGRVFVVYTTQFMPLVRVPSTCTSQYVQVASHRRRDLDLARDYVRKRLVLQAVLQLRATYMSLSYRTLVDNDDRVSTTCRQDVPANWLAPPPIHLRAGPTLAWC